MSAETEYVGNQRIFSEIAQGRLASEIGKAVIGGNENLAVPAIARDQQQVREQVLRTGRYREIDFVRRNHIRDLLRRSLVQVQTDARVARSEFTNYVR